MCNVKSITPYTVQLQLHVSYHSSPTPGEGTNHRIATFEVVQSYLQHQYNTSGVLPTSADHPCLGSYGGENMCQVPCLRPTAGSWHATCCRYLSRAGN